MIAHKPNPQIQDINHSILFSKDNVIPSLSYVTLAHSQKLPLCLLSIELSNHLQ